MSRVLLTLPCEFCGDSVETYNASLVICFLCFERWKQGCLDAGPEQEARIVARLDEIFGDGGEVHMEHLGREDDREESRAEARHQAH